MSDLHCPARLVCVRHGEGADNIGPVMKTAAPGLGLTPAGRDQAVRLADSLARERVAAVYTSPLRRAIETGEIAARHLGVGVSTVEDLREFSVGVLEGLPMASAGPQCLEIFLGWFDGALDRAVEGGESGRQVIDRMGRALADIADRHRGETALVVSHGGALSVALPALCGTPGPPAELGNCDGALVEQDADGWALRTWGPLRSGTRA